MTEGASPWSNDGVPARTGSLEIDWSAIRAPEPAPPRRRRRFGRLIACLGGIAATIVVIAAWPAPTVAEPEASRPLLEQFPNVTTTTVPAATSSTPHARSDPEPAPTSIALPDALRQASRPAELVVLGMDGVVHTVSLPSGRVQSVDVGFNGFFDGELLASRHATLISSFGRGVTLVGRDKVVTPIADDDLGTDSTGLGPIITIDGHVDGESDEPAFLLTVRDRTTGAAQRVSVRDQDGAVSLVGPALHRGAIAAPRSDGLELANEAGGVYLLHDGRTERLANGRAVAATRSHVLVRECDARLRCGYVLTSIADGTGVGLDLPIRLPGSGVSLAPDNSALSFTTFGPRNDRVLVGLDGTIASAPIRVDNLDSATWAADGSGEVLVPRGTGLVFLEIETGIAHEFGKGLGPIAAIDLRALGTEAVELPVK